MLFHFTQFFLFNQAFIHLRILAYFSEQSTCPRCSQAETWEHIIRCQKTTQFRKEFIVNLAKEMIQVNQNDVLPDEIFIIIEDILIFMEGGDEEEYKTNEYMVGMTNLFRGYSVKVRKGVNF